MNEIVISIIGILGIGFIITLLYKFLIPVAQGNKAGNNAGGGLSQGDVVDKANVLYEMGQISKAISLLEEYIKKNPNDLTVREFLGDYLMEKNLLGKAEKNYIHIIKLDSNNKGVLEKLADCYYYDEKNDKAICGFGVFFFIRWGIAFGTRHTRNTKSNSGR